MLWVVTTLQSTSICFTKHVCKRGNLMLITSRAKSVTPKVMLFPLFCFTSLPNMVHFLRYLTCCESITREHFSITSKRTSGFRNKSVNSNVWVPYMLRMTDKRQKAAKVKCKGIESLTKQSKFAEYSLLQKKHLSFSGAHSQMNTTLYQNRPGKT